MNISSKVQNEILDSLKILFIYWDKKGGLEEGIFNA